MSEIGDISGMKQDDWKIRLGNALKERDMSAREVSLAAQLNAGYVHSILKTDRDPSIDHLRKVCKALGVSLSYVLFGIDLEGDQEETLNLLMSAPAEAREGILKILRGMLQAESQA